jgi:N-acyl-D-amino-acid deacylase
VTRPATAAALLALLSMALHAQTSGRPAQRTPFDLVITNGTVIDGTGSSGHRADVGVRAGRIAEIGQLQNAAAAERINAAGLVVAPGFIDVHTHADDIADHPLAENFAQMGVTTIVAGNCGSSALDISDAFDRIREVGISINYATLIGHNTVRSAVMGSHDVLPRPDDLRRMKSFVFKAMIDGAVGFSTGLQYIPGTYAKTNEITELARVAGNEGGIYATHMRNEGTALEDAIKESITVARLTEAPLEISHLKIDSPAQWGASAKALALIDDARRRGLKVQADQYAYTAGSSSLSIRFPSWALEGGSADVKKRLGDPAIWARIKKEMQGLLEERGFTDLSWATIATYRADPSLNGLTMKQAAEKLKGTGDLDAQLELARDMQAAGGASMVYHERRRCGGDHAASDGIDRLGRRHQRAGARRAASARVRRQRPRPWQVRARGQGHHDRRGHPQDDVAAGAVLWFCRPRGHQARRLRGPRRVRSREDR